MLGEPLGRDEYEVGVCNTGHCHPHVVQAIQDQYPLQIVRGADGKPTNAIAGYVANVDQTFGGLFKPSSPPPGRAQPKCVKRKLPWQGKIREVRNGRITNAIVPAAYPLSF